MKRTFVFIAFFAFVMGKMFAWPVDVQRAQHLGQRFLSSTSLGEHKSDIQLQLVYVSATREAVDYYVFNVNDGHGFVIIAGDDRVKPILAYSTTGCFNPDDIAEGFAFTLNSYSSEIQYVRDNNLEATADIKAEWKSVAETGHINIGRETRSVVGPLCQTIWNQNFPYNSQCPEDEEGNGGHVYAGCVATAMCQVMKFWDYPARGIGSHTYTPVNGSTFEPSGYPDQTANFGETDYHFELMPNSLDSLSTEADYFYIAQLLHHAGISVEMMYGPNGSGAYSYSVPSALQSYFGYSCDDVEEKEYLGFIFYTNDEWKLMLKQGGLDEGMPLYYSGSDDNGGGGHAFVCDGYDENDYFHFNWGWSGKDDAWCAIGALNTTKYAFNSSNAFIGHIRPNTSTYNRRPESISDFEVIENEDYSSVTISWTNPENNLNGQPLTDFTVYVYRGSELVYQTADSRNGEAMNYVDDNLEAGLYQYSIIAENSFGFSKREYSQILVGDKCDIVFELTDTGGDGWKGACISVTDENGNRIGIVTMTEGSEQTAVVPLLKGNLNFIWNHGWYHTSEQYDTDYECHFIIKNSEDEVLYTSGNHSDGVFMTYNNDCDNTWVAEASTSNVRLYPNPTNGIINVEGNGEMTISVMNMLGQKVMEVSANDNAVVDLSNCESGIYMVKIETVNGIIVEKIDKR